MTTTDPADVFAGKVYTKVDKNKQEVIVNPKTGQPMSEEAIAE